MLKHWITSKLLAKIFKPFLCILLGALLVFLIFDTSTAQSRRTITGTVTDAADGVAIPAVNIVVEGTLIGTSTNIDGTYSLSIPADAETLVFSSIGYITLNVQINGRSAINVEMSQDVQFLDDVIVVGYGSQEEKEITSSVTSVSAEDFNLGNVSEPVQLIQGKVPGLSVYNRGGDPNASPTIRLRGISTVGANTEPLFVIDGVIGGSIDNLDPSDIASMSVLKDGSAAAIYGSRASSGVIIVTTKKGSDLAGLNKGDGVAEVTYSSYVSIASVLDAIDVLTADQFVANGGNDLGARNDWLDRVTRDAMSNVQNIAVSGGTLNTNYRVSFNYRDIEGILEDSGFEQFNARINLSHRTFNDKLNLNFNYSLTNRESDYSFSDALRYGVLFNPTAPVFGADANIGDAEFYAPSGGYFYPFGLFDSFNPVAMLDLNQNLGESKDLLFAAEADYDIMDNWSASVSYSRQSGDQLNAEYYSVYDWYRGNGAGGPGIARRYTDNDQQTLVEAYTTYSQTLSKLDATLTGGYSYQQNNFEDFFVQAGDFLNDDLLYNAFENSGNIKEAGLIQLSSNASPDEKIIAGFVRGNFTWDNAIFFNASVRREGSTKLGEDNKWGIFPAFGVGTDITNWVEVGPLDQLKLRVGYGVTGSLPANSGLSQDLYTDDGNGNITFDRGANKDLKWEEKAELNIGLDFGGEKFGGTIEVYNRDINDFIIARTVESSAGFSTQVQNAGKINTKGFELAFDYDVIQNNDMYYNTGITFSTYESTLEEYTFDGAEMQANLGAPGQNSTNLIRVAVGEEIGQIWGPVYSGTVDENGVPIMVDLNGDGDIVSNQDAALLENGDFKQLGNGFPDFEIGWTNQFSYKNWDLNAFFRGAFGHSLVNTYRAFYEPRIPSQGSYNLVNTKYADDAIKSAQFSSLYVEEADFFKLDNLTIGYNFDVSTLDFISSARVYFSGQNLFVITDYTGVDPEPQLQDLGAASNGDRLGTPNVLAPGIDRRYNYFSSRTFTLGINLKF